MSRTIVITGCASGIGRAAYERLRAKGDTVIGVDLHDADVVADLASPAGLQEMLAEVDRLTGGSIDAVVACAGVLNVANPSLTLAVNYFSAVATLEGLRPLLAGSAHPRAVAICSTAAKIPGNAEVVEACLAMDQAAALAAASVAPATAYGDSKRALALWLRRTAALPEWGGSGILLNGIAPGIVETEMTRSALDEPATASLMKASHPVAIGRYGFPAEIAELIDFLANFESGYLLGQVIFADGGTDTILRPSEF